MSVVFSFPLIGQSGIAPRYLLRRSTAGAGIRHLPHLVQFLLASSRSPLLSYASGVNPFLQIAATTALKTTTVRDIVTAVQSTKDMASSSTDLADDSDTDVVRAISFSVACLHLLLPKKEKK